MKYFYGTVQKSKSHGLLGLASIDSTTSATKTWKKASFATKSSSVVESVTVEARIAQNPYVTSCKAISERKQ